MSRLATTVEQEKLDFQKMLCEVMPWGARLGQLDANFVTDNRQGAIDIFVSTCTVLEVGLNAEGVTYQVHFGPVDVYGADIDEIDPAQTWTLQLTDPIIDLRDGTYAVEMLHGDGASFDPERYLLINPKLTEGQMRNINNGKELL